MKLPDKTPAILFYGPDDIRVHEVELPPLGDEDIAVRTRYSMVSTGTELRALTGFYKSVPFPFIPGYSSVGEVVACGKSTTGYRPGDLVSCRNANPFPAVNHCWGGQAGYHLYNIHNPDTKPVLLPEGADPLDYVGVEIGAISLRGVKSSQPQPGQTAVVIGLGIIGAYVAAWLQQAGCRVIVSDLSPTRLQRIAAWGPTPVIGGKPDSVERLRELLGGGADIVVECSGSMPGLALAISLTRAVPERSQTSMLQHRGRWSKLLLQATYREPVSFSKLPGEGIILLTPKDRSVEDRLDTIEAIRTGRLCAAHFRDRVVSYSEAPEHYLTVRDNPDAVFSLVFDWSDLNS
jgi:2-desacetyl-2-hydroxyethyl bacteriochlorophyllide A dehydrogenase